MSPFSRDFYLIDLAVQPARCPDTRAWALGCHLTVADMLSSVCLALTPSRRHRGVNRQKVADIAAWGRTADPCLGAD